MIYVVIVNPYGEVEKIDMYHSPIVVEAKTAAEAKSKVMRTFKQARRDSLGAYKALVVR